MVASASSDATIRIWNLTTSECLSVVKLQNRRPGDAISINRVVPLQDGRLLICDRSDTLDLLDVENPTVSLLKYKCPNPDEEFVSATYCMGYVYGATRERNIYCFHLETGILESNLKVEDGKEIIGLEHDPTRKILAAYTLKGPLVLFK
mmetsp:Transcript_23230/g.28575  ORF Transcript_23230/g.28575 Transcript_23230/m.28575 type:complete len:149 (-) Transcript_23230:1456-1902(-)